jgi:type VI secretion system Hcp family effector
MPLAASLKAGPIIGTGIQKGREKEITVTSFTHKVTTQIDPTSGAPGKTRTHTPFVIQKNIDIATPALHQAHANGTELEPFTLRLFHMPSSGPEAHYFTITLTGAKIVKIQSVFPALQDPKNANVHEYEQVSFEYDTINWKEEAVAAFGRGERIQPGIASYGDKIKGNAIFETKWEEAYAKLGVMKIVAELKAAGFAYGTKLYDNMLNKLTGKKPVPDPVEPPGEEVP